MNGKQFWLGLLGCSLLFGAGCGIKNQSATNWVSPNPANAEVKTAKNKYILGEFLAVNGTDYLSAPVYIVSSGKGRSDSSSYDSYEYKDGRALTNNYVFVNQKDLSSRKLLPDNKAVILDKQQYEETGNKPDLNTKQDPMAKPNNIKSVLYKVVKADTNNDKVLNGQDKKTIAVSDADGSNYKELVPGIEKILKIHNPSKNKQVVLYQTGSDFFAASIDIPGRSAQINKLQSIAD
jgi:hypothetical protein